MEGKLQYGPKMELKQVVKEPTKPGNGYNLYRHRSFKVVHFNKGKTKTNEGKLYPAGELSYILLIMTVWLPLRGNVISPGH